MSARERIDRAAYELFARQGVRAVGVDAIIAKSGVAKMTLYRHYRSKDALAIAFLARREALWTHAWFCSEVERRARTPCTRLLAIFDVFDGWFHRTDFEGCSFINVLLEISDRAHPVRIATVLHLAEIRTFVQKLAEDAQVADAEGFARQWHILMKGSIIAAGEGDADAARRAKEMGAQLLARKAGSAARRKSGGAGRRKIDTAEVAASHHKRDAAKG